MWSFSIHSLTVILLVPTVGICGYYLVQEKPHWIALSRVNKYWIGLELGFICIIQVRLGVPIFITTALQQVSIT